MVPHIHLGECPKIDIIKCDRSSIRMYVRMKVVRIDSHSKSCVNTLGNQATVKAGTVFKATPTINELVYMMQCN